MADKPTLERVFDLARQLSTLDRTRLVQRLMAGIEHELVNGPVDPRRRPQPNPPPVAEDLEQLTYNIIGCAMTVHREQGPSYREDTYQRDLEVHLLRNGLVCAPQKSLEVYDSAISRRLIGYYIPDFIIENQVIVEIKALSGLDDSHTAQVIGYLAVSGCSVGILINFGKRSLDWKRILPPKKLEDHHVNRQWLFVPDWLKNEAG